MPVEGGRSRPRTREVQGCRGLAWVVLALLPNLASHTVAQGGGRARDGWPRPTPPAQEGSTPDEEFLPGFDAGPSTPARRKTPAKPPAKPAASKPPDPLAEADAVTGMADHHARMAAAEEQLLQEYFQLCDLDENGWISLREAQGALALERTEYRRVDANQDGRLDAGEFARERRSLLARLGALPEAEPPVTEREPALGPEPPPTTTLAPAPDPAAANPTLPALRSEFGAMTVKPGAFLRRFDADQSGGVSGAELEAALAQGGLALSAAQALEVLDRNDSRQLEAGELFPFAWLASKARPAPTAPAETEPTPPPAGTEVAQPLAKARPPGPGGGSHFSRLDPNADDHIDEADLRALQSPARLDLRLRAVLSALDRDGDGRLSEAEFRAAMGDRAR